MKNGHVYYTCSGKCEGYCNYCDGGLAYCTLCTGGEGSLASECPGRKMTPEEDAAVYAGDLDFKEGKWVEVGRRQICGVCGDVSVMGRQRGDGRCREHLNVDLFEGFRTFNVELNGHPGAWEGRVVARCIDGHRYTESFESKTPVMISSDISAEIYAAVQRCVQRHAHRVSSTTKEKPDG